MQIACPHCLTKNRVPDERLDDAPRCGQCRQPLFPGAPVAMDGDALSRFAAATGVPVVADFWADWCGPCKAMAPAFAAAAGARPRVQFVKIDTGASPNAGARFAIRGIPTMIVFRNGAEHGRITGALPPAQLLAWVDQQVGG